MSADPNLAILVFARLDSRRLPGKTMTPLAGRPILGRVVDRLRRVAGSPAIVVATSDRALDDPIAAFAKSEGVDVFRGTLDDVARRAHDCALARGFKAIVRISADSPFIDPAVIGAVIARFRQGDADLATNVFPRSYPPGVSVEVLATEALGRMLALTDDGGDREHVTRYIYAHADRFRIANVTVGDDRYSGVGLTVDTPDDLVRAAWIAGRLGTDLASASLDRTVALARAWQEGQR